ncbi:MAG: zinc metallopeptidase [Phycisphaerales bacterium]|nr:zinc metallopeptidase [Phycisphaerales bacterium]
MIFDPLYLMILAPGILLGLWAQWKVKSAFANTKQMPVSSRLTGAEAAARILANHHLDHVGIEPANGMLGDHYDPRSKTLRLSPDVYNGRSIAAVGVAAHEAGHALQDQQRYAPLALRNGIVPMANVGSNLSWILLIIGMMMGSFQLMIAGVALFSIVVFFQLINLPVEFNASSRARKILVTNGIITPSEEPAVAKVLNAAALTYVAATITAILTLLYFLIRSGLLGGRR